MGDPTNFIFFVAVLISLLLGGFAIYRCWKDPQRAKVEKVVFTFFIVICPYLGALIFFRAQNAKKRYEKSVWHRAGRNRRGDEV